MSTRFNLSRRYQRLYSLQYVALMSRRYNAAKACRLRMERIKGNINAYLIGI